MKKYFSFFRIRFANTLQYRAAALGGIATQFAWGFMLLLMFSAFYESNSNMPMTFPQLASYIWLQQAFLALLNFWFFDSELLEMISGGQVAYELLRPTDTYAMWFAKDAATRLGRTVLRCAPILVIAIFLPAPFNLSAPASPAAFFLFLLSLLLGMCVVLGVMLLVYISTFYTVNSVGVRIVVMALAEFLAGGVVPLPFFPDSIRPFVELSPFGCTQNLPFRIYNGSIGGGEAGLLVAVQILWIALLVLAGSFWLRRSLKHVVIQGG